MNANIGLKEDHLNEIASALNKLLADEYVLVTKTRYYHWNIVGPNFSELHKFYEEQYEELSETVDEIAERVRALGRFAEGRIGAFLEISSLEEQGLVTRQEEQIRNLLHDHEAIIREIRALLPKISDEYHDEGTADFVTGIMEQHEKMAWMLRAYLG